MKSLFESCKDISRENNTRKRRRKSRNVSEKLNDFPTSSNVDKNADLPYDPEDSNILLDGDIEVNIDIDESIKSISLSEGEIIDEFEFDQIEDKWENDIEELELRKRCLKSLEARTVVSEDLPSKPKRKRKRRRRRKSHLQVSGILATVSSHKTHRDQTDAFLQFTGVSTSIPHSLPPLPPPPPPPPPLPLMSLRPSHSYLCPEPPPVRSWTTHPDPRLDDDFLSLFGTQDIDLRKGVDHQHSLTNLTVLDNYDHVQMDICTDDDIHDSIEDEIDDVDRDVLDHDLNMQLRQLREEVDDQEMIPPPEDPTSDVHEEQDDELEHVLRRRLLESLKRRKEKSTSVTNSPNYATDSNVKDSGVSTPTQSAPLSPKYVEKLEEKNEVVKPKGTMDTKLSNIISMKRATQAPLSRRYVITVDDASSDEELKIRNEMKKLNSNASLKEMMMMKQRCHSCISELHSQVDYDRRELRNLTKQLQTCRNERKKLAEICNKLRNELESYEQNLRRVKSTEYYFTDRLRRIRTKVKDRHMKYKDMNNDLAQLIYKIRGHPQAKDKVKDLNVNAVDGEVPLKKRKLDSSKSIKDTEMIQDPKSVKLLPLRHVQSAPVLSTGSVDPEKIDIDPYQIVCPYHLHGKCKQQADCPYQHPSFPNNVKKENNALTKVHCPENEVIAVQKRVPTGSGLCTKFRCPACQMILRIPTLHLRQDSECRSCTHDHLLSLHHCLCRLDWCRSHNKNTTPILKRIMSLVESVKLSGDSNSFDVLLMKHCLVGWLAVQQGREETAGVDRLYGDAFEFVKPYLAKLNFCEESVWFVYDQLVSYTARKSLLLSAFDVVRNSNSFTYALKIVTTLIQLECMAGQSISASLMLKSLLKNPKTGWISEKGRMYLWCLYLYLTATNDAPYFEISNSNAKLVSASELLSLIPDRCLNTRKDRIKRVSSEALSSVVQSTSANFESIALKKTKFDLGEDTDAYFSIIEVYLKLMLYNMPDDDDDDDEEENVINRKEQNELFQSILHFSLSFFNSDKDDSKDLRPNVITLFIYYLTWAFQNRDFTDISWEWFEDLCGDNEVAFNNLLPLFIYMTALNIGVSDDNRTIVEGVIERMGKWLFSLSEKDATSDCECLYKNFLGLDCASFTKNGKYRIQRRTLEENGSVVYIWLCYSMLLHLQNKTKDVLQVITEIAVPALSSRHRDVSVLLCFALWSARTGLEGQLIDMEFYTQAADKCLALVCTLNSVSTVLKVVSEIEIGYLLAGDKRNIACYRSCVYFGRQSYPIIRHIVGDFISLKEYRTAFSICQDLCNEKVLPCGERFWMLYIRTAELCELDLSIQLEIIQNACRNVPMSRRLWNSYRNYARLCGAKDDSTVMKEIDKELAKLGIV